MQISTHKFSISQTKLCVQHFHKCQPLSGSLSLFVSPYYYLLIHFVAWSANLYSFRRWASFFIVSTTLSLLFSFRFFMQLIFHMLLFVNKMLWLFFKIQTNRNRCCCLSLLLLFVVCISFINVITLICRFLWLVYLFFGMFFFVNCVCLFLFHLFFFFLFFLNRFITIEQVVF